MKRREIVAALCLMPVVLLPARAAELPPMTIWKSPWCGCCTAWAQHMKDAGFRVEITEVEDLAPVKSKAGVPHQLQSCHTATVAGLAVPGMPSGSPGMENGHHDAYNVMSFTRDGKSTVFSSYE